MKNILRKCGSLCLCAALIVSVFSITAGAAIGQTDYVIDDNGNKTSLPMCYVPEKRISNI